MPLEVIESTDPLTGLIRFETSPVFEMLISLHVLLAPDAQPEWRAQTRAALSPELLQELEAVYGPYWNGFLFLELAVDCPDHQDVPGFIRYVRAMTPDRFLFYLVGRMIPVEAIAATGAASAADMGKLMGVLKPALAGQADMGLVSKLVKQKLS